MHLNIDDQYQNYEAYKEFTLDKKRFSYYDLIPLFKKIHSSRFEVTSAGTSADGKDIKLIRYGRGPLRVLAWSQMHGDESTATMALFDLINFLSSNDRNNSIRDFLNDKLSIYIVPMLNPDGADQYKRRNAFEIDLNRDALRLQTPEGKILQSLRNSIEPSFGFNLHDQNSRYSVGKTFRSSTISLLAPPFNAERSINNVRSESMKLIVDIYKMLSRYIPGHISRYDDSFEPRAFGDNFMKQGTSIVLIESGGWKNDDEKQFIRKLNYLSLLHSLFSIANSGYAGCDVADYFFIPENDKLIFDLLLKNLRVKYKNNEYLTDIGINRDEISVLPEGSCYYKAYIEDIGDLSIYYGYEEYDLDGYSLEPGMVFPEIINDYADLASMDFEKLHKDGYINVRVRNSSGFPEYSVYPVNILAEGVSSDSSIRTEGPANFVIKKNNNIEYTVVNGFICDPKLRRSCIKNGLILK